jgi:iron complex outermembrane recepter protein
MSSARNFASALLAGVAIIALSATSAAAQDNAAPQDNPEKPKASDNDIVVTANKREQVAQDIPLAITAVGAASIERSGYTSLTEVTNRVAGISLTIPDSPFYSHASIRGVTSLQGALDSNAAIGLYLDEVPLSTFTSNLPLTSLLDVKRVEVLRGPQGALFGEGSMGGTIRVISNTPDASAFSGSILARGAVTDGGAPSYDLTGVLNVPVTDNLAIRGAVQQIHRGGWIDVPGLHTKDANSYDETDARLKLRWQPTDALTVDLLYLYQNLNVDGWSQATSPGVYDPKALAPQALDPTRIARTFSKRHLGNATISWDLGPATLVSASSYVSERSGFDSDPSPVLPLIVGGGTGKALWEDRWKPSFFTQEFRLVSNGDHNFDWTVGVYYRNVRRYTHQYYPLTEIKNSFFNVLLGQAEINDYSIAQATNRSRSYAVFGQFDWQIASRLSATVGGRYFIDNKSNVQEELSNSILTGLVAGRVETAKDTDKAFSPSASLNFDISDRARVFARVAKGFRPGGSNTTKTLDPSIPAGYVPETLWAYEFGLKTEPVAGTVVNAYLFDNEWTDLQLNFVAAGLPGVNIGYVGNAGHARAQGAELEVTTKLSSRLSVLGNVSYTDAKITETVRDLTGAIRATAGNPIPYTPRWQIGAAADYIVPMGSVDGFFHLDYKFASSHQTDSSNDPQQLNGASHDLGLRAGIETDRWRVALYGQNVLNRDDELAVFYVNKQSAPILRYTTYTRPRTIGVEFSLKFGGK